MFKLYNYLRKPNRLVLFFIPVAFIWMLYLVKIQLDLQRLHVDKDYLRGKIIELSKEYVKAVAKDRISNDANAIDGQSVVEVPDMKQTTSVLLQNMLDRLMVLEKQVENVVSQSALDISKLSEKVKSLNQSLRSFAGNLTRGAVLRCKVPNDPNYPECAGKVKWLSEHWKSDAKYSENGVNGSLCSFLFYLSEVEAFCPLQEGRGVVPNTNDCKVPKSAAFPHCQVKVNWMITSWKTDPCYAKDFGVNGTICSFLLYLSEVEAWCPRLPGRNYVSKREPTVGGDIVDVGGTSMEKLIDELTKAVAAEARLKWIRTRAIRMYSYWSKAMNALQSRVNVTDKPVKKILVHIGVLAEEKTLHFAQTADKGGPLGELVQWCDLVTSLYILGHDIRVTVEHSEMLSALTGSSGTTKRSCPPKNARHVFDVIFTDYYGLVHLKKKSKPLFQHYKCKLRIVDSFGTEVQFNFNGPLPSIGNPAPVGGNMFGKNELDLKQYMTMFPHSPDNTFLGFVVDSKGNVPTAAIKKQQALTYGKHYYMWKDLKNRGFLDVIHENFEIHATTGGLPLDQVKAYLPPYVVNHGVVGPANLQKLLEESKIFVGLGFPYEGPAPLEAIAQGCFFINPKFKSAKNRENTKFFNGKPTFRALTSQHPYAEEFIGEPRVLTVDIDDPAAVKVAIEKIKSSESSPYLPFEYTHEGMLERINALLHNLDFCQQRRDWPPLTSRSVISGNEGQSCKDVCLKNGLVCEPAYFESINNAKFLEKALFPCSSDGLRVKRSSLVAPAYVRGENVCVLQAVPALYSCTAYHNSVKRICPCRDYRKGQVALCKTCY